ncbi:arginine--tRNA ligase [Ereboglobus luteus]|uniref:Arginine--tRNA ligase n=1 Tax=Ereboglobus luteus TaxID=1796921 RepID=A0A2U8DZZ8_9BACT|nr:arginine--tRNA ligase [Ereboglobus luteus]AWI08105.1 arginine--tRNA ligase [Ereboglobus luteus]
MHVSFNIAADIDAAMKTAVAAAGIDAASFAPEVRTADPRNGDFQANGVLAFAKRNKQNPRALAEQIIAALPDEIKARFDTAIAGPGFINFTLKPAALFDWLNTYDSIEKLSSGASSAYAGQTWVVDYSSPNTAKQMHVGHLRSAVIGEAICRLLEFSGAKVIRDNHLGDWGTQFGKLIYGYKRWLDKDALARDPISELERLYKLGNEATPDGSPELEEARQELVKLQRGDYDSLELWKLFSEVSKKAFDEIYKQLAIKFDHYLGESFYNDKLQPVLDELQKLGLAEESQGALVVFHPEHPRFAKQPFIVRKSDGASNYATTDLATMLYRVEHFHADGIVILTDFRQSDHFEQLALTAEKWFAKTGRRMPRFAHVTFGAVLGENNKPLKTRDGDTIKLKELLGEAEERAYTIVSEKNAGRPKAEQFTDEECRAIAHYVGIGAVQYADLSQNRSSDYLFSWDKMLSLDGNTAPYLLYAIARIHSIFRKAGIEPEALAAIEKEASPLETPTELALARKLVKFPDALRLATDTLRPHFLALYLYELAGDYSAFNNADKVLVDDTPVRARRLLLCARTQLTLNTGLNLLGVRTLKRM